MNITFRQLKAFASIARHHSFSKAAAELHLTQSSLSGLIKEMEKQLDMRLFDRTTRQIHLTEAGERLLPHANKVLNDMQLMSHEVHDLQDYHQGKVRIAAPQQLAAASIPKLIRLFKEAYPDIQVTLIDCSIEEVVDHVQMLEADIGLGPDLLHSNELMQTRLFRSSFGLVVRADHPLADSKALTWQDLNEGDLITVQAPFADHINEKLPLDIRTRLFRSDYQVNFLSTALGMVKEGLGITMALGYAKSWVDEQGLVMIPIHEPQIGYEFMLYKHRQRSQTPAMKSFENFLLKASKDWLLHI